MIDTAKQLDPDVQAISRVLNSVFSRYYDGTRRTVLIEALRMLSENDRRILLHGFRQLLAVRINFAIKP